jgi:hypothetical protein
VRKAIAAEASAPALLFSVVLPGSMPAWGADAAGDLEARVAELEATAAPSGNSKLSFHQYGQINRALLMWKDEPKNTTKLPAEPWQGFVIGARIQF